MTVAKFLDIKEGFVGYKNVLVIADEAGMLHLIAMHRLIAAFPKIYV
jgi:hypothetical protein